MNFETFKKRYLLVECKSFLYKKRSRSTSKGKILHDNLSEDFFNTCYKLCKIVSYQGCEYLIIDIIEEKVICTFNGKKTSSMTITNKGINCIEEVFNDYICIDKHMIYNQNMLDMVYLTSIEEVYSIDGVWIAIKYLSKQNNTRYLINKNAYMDEKYFLSRDYKIKCLTV